MFFLLLVWSGSSVFVFIVNTLRSTVRCTPIQALCVYFYRYESVTDAPVRNLWLHSDLDYYCLTKVCLCLRIWLFRSVFFPTYFIRVVNCNNILFSCIRGVITLRENKFRTIRVETESQVHIIGPYVLWLPANAIRIFGMVMHWNAKNPINHDRICSIFLFAFS